MGWAVKGAHQVAGLEVLSLHINKGLVFVLKVLYNKRLLDFFV